MKALSKADCRSGKIIYAHAKELVKICKRDLIIYWDGDKYQITDAAKRRSIEMMGYGIICTVPSDHIRLVNGQTITGPLSMDDPDGQLVEIPT